MKLVNFNGNIAAEFGTDVAVLMSFFSDLASNQLPPFSPDITIAIVKVSINRLRVYMPFWTQRQISNTIRKAVEYGLLIQNKQESKSSMDKTMSYSITKEFVDRDKA
jgi:hypothetical protein